VLGDAVAALLADPVLTAGLPGLLGEVLPGFLSTPAVAAGLALAAGDLVATLAGGADPLAAAQSVLDALLDDAEVRAALVGVVTEVVGGTLADAQLLTLVGSVVAQSVSGVLAVDGVAAFAGEQVAGLVAGLLGDTPMAQGIAAVLADAVAGLLAEPAVGDVLAVVAATITDFLGQPRIDSLLADTVGQLVTALLNGGDPTTAAQDALSSLQSQAAFRDAIRETLPQAVNVILGASDLREAVARTAGSVVTGLLNEFGINVDFIDRLSDQLTRSAVEALLASPAVAKLVSNVGVGLLTGSSVPEVTDNVVRALLTDWTLQLALGTSLGAGVGSLFGDNIFGAVIGDVVGFGSSVVIALAGGITWLFIDGGPVIRAAAAAGGPVSDGYFFELLPTTDDLSTMRATLLQGPDAAVVRSMSATGNPFTLTEGTFTQPETSAQPGFLRLRIAVDGAKLSLGADQDVQVLVAASFGFDPLGRHQQRDTATTGAIPRSGAALA